MSHKPFVRSSNIRDFRVDQKPGTAESTPQARQELRSRQNLVTEWTTSKDSLDQLWDSWTHEQKPNNQNENKNSVNLEQKAVAHKSLATQKNSAPAPTKVAHEENFEGQSQASPKEQLPWAIELAMDERRLEKAGAVDMSNAFGRQEILKIRTREFAQQLQKSFREQIELFNESRKSAAQTIHVYKVAGAPDDFMLFRNGLKLLISAQRSGKIQFAFNQFIGQLHAPNHQSVTEIDASWGAFDQLLWTYRGERVQLNDIVRYFLTEFSRQSFR